MKSVYIAISVLAMIAAIMLLSGCTSGPATSPTANVTAPPLISPTTSAMANMTGPVTGAGAMSDNPGTSDMAINNSSWMSSPGMISGSGNNTSVTGIATGMNVTANSTMAGNVTAKPTVASMP